MRFLFRYFITRKKFTQKISELEKKISFLEASLTKEKTANENQVNSKPLIQESTPNIIIEHIHVDQIVIEHVDYANNFGQLGIKDLSGKLNIGTTYEGDLTKLLDEKIAEKLGKQAKVNLRAKKENERESPNKGDGDENS
ncbi:hypothetical protein HPT25_16495 [Bacillus sp. BRMEA1]|uniref:hypothetical protein n=1 Tax=Neobacillus endophyticus TaxID=2738405 RepID=UPI001565B923|nr:hypothetical protein [Neobacillus endophyticus]NRD78965.1 hypothetical protein [Neobacillus endophyticus]